jgi:hypothetical protein
MFHSLWTILVDRTCLLTWEVNFHPPYWFRPRGSVYTSSSAPGIKESTTMIESNHVTGNNSGRTKLTAHVCPVCSREFPSMSMEDFQQHVFECIDDGDDKPLQTLQNPTMDDTNGIDRICPMCNKSFANTLP